VSDSVTLPKVPTIRFQTEEGETLLECSLLKLNTLIAEAQSGLTNTDPNYAEVYCSRLAYALQQVFNVEVSPEQAYVIGEHALARLMELKGNFGKGR